MDYLEKCEKEYGAVEYGEKTYVLKQNPYIGGGQQVINNYGGYLEQWYEASATFDGDDEYKVIWEIINESDDGDEIDACNWNKPSAVIR